MDVLADAPIDGEFDLTYAIRVILWSKVFIFK